MKADYYTGWDIGGAHLKFARLDRRGALLCAAQYAMPLWQGIHTLTAAVRQGLTSAPAGHGIHAVTMTGELADCFSGRREGVRCIVEQLTGLLADATRIRIYAGEQGLLSPGQAVSRYDAVASANWHASARYSASHLSAGILVDIGTTTTDIIPFREGRVCNQGYSDQQRMRTGELVYTGVVRTPVMALAQHVLYKNKWQSIAAEQFATTADVYRITGQLAEALDQHPSADGAPKTRSHSIRRLARMLGADYCADEDAQPWLDVARRLAERQFNQVELAYRRVRNSLGDSAPGTIVAAGMGRFLSVRLAEQYACRLVDFAELMPLSGPDASCAANCTTALAVAGLLHKEIS